MAWQLVYSLKEELRTNPERVRLTRTATLDQSRPSIGLSSESGLYGSEEWWRNIESGRIATEVRTGVVTGTFYAGMDSDQPHNSFEYEDEAGKHWESDFWVGPKEGAQIYRPGVRVRLTYIVLPMKRRDTLGNPVLLPFIFTLEADDQDPAP